MLMLIMVVRLMMILIKINERSEEGPFHSTIQTLETRTSIYDHTSEDTSTVALHPPFLHLLLHLEDDIIIHRRLQHGAAGQANILPTRIHDSFRQHSLVHAWRHRPRPAPAPVRPAVGVSALGPAGVPVDPFLAGSTGRRGEPDGAERSGALLAEVVYQVTDCVWGRLLQGRVAGVQPGALGA